MSQDAAVNVREALARGTQFLEAAGVGTPRLDMELILAEALGTNRLGLYMQVDRVLSPEERERSRAMLTRRREREPMAYILGYREFYGLRFDVTPAVLIPRPETELLVDAVLNWLRAREATIEPPVLADIGTGSGAIPIAALVNQEKTQTPGRWMATDVSPEALDVAKANARKHGVAERIEFRVGAFFEPLDAPVDCICSNPPYVAEADRESLEPEVAKWEPAGALFSGPFGMDHLERLIGEAPRHLRTGGAMFLEIGFGQRDLVAEAIERAGQYEAATFHEDHAGISRVLEVRRA